MERSQKEALKNLDIEEISALAYGFPLLSNDEYDDFVGSEPTDRTDVNGDWKPLETGFDDFNFLDDDFDNFLTKKARQRNKRRRELRQRGRASGKSRRDARKDARKQALDEIPKDKLKEIVKRTAGNVGRGILKGVLAPHRASYMALVRLNFRGSATKLNALINLKNGNSKSNLDALKKRWRNLGGQFDKLVKSVNVGRNKKPFFCGKKCKKKIANEKVNLPKKNFVDGYEEIQFDEYSNLVLGGVEIGVGALLGFAGTCISALAGVTNKIITTSKEKKEIKSQERVALQSQKDLSDADKRAYEIEMARVRNEVDPSVAIAENPNLSAEEKASAINSLEKVKSSDLNRNIIKYGLFGGLVLGGLLVVNKILNK